MRGKSLVFVLMLILLSSIALGERINIGPVEGTDCAAVCSYWPNSYPVLKSDPYDWKYDNELYSRMSFTKDNEQCWCECQEGYKWQPTSDEYGIIMIGNCAPVSPTISGNYNFPPKRGGWTEGCGHGIMECVKIDCGNSKVSVLEEACPDERRSTRDCCCKEGYVVQDNYCVKVDESKFIKGRLFLDDDQYQYPYGGVKNARVIIEYEGKTLETKTDEAGNFEVEAELKLGKQVKVIILLEDDNLRVIDAKVNDYDTVEIEKKQRVSANDLKEGMDIEIILNKKQTPSSIDSPSDMKDIPGLVKEYIIFQDAGDFTSKTLKANVQKFEVLTNDPTVRTICGGARACYSSTTKTIHLSEDSITFTTKDSPHVEFHEYGHHTMYSQFRPVYPAGTESHKGFLNPDTSESLQEGEADFLALMVFETTLKNHPSFQTRKTGIMNGDNYEINYKPWQYDGQVQREEYAVSTLLFDLYDKFEDKIDTDHSISSSAVDDVQIPITEIWSIISKSSTNTVQDLYDALIRKYDQKDIDKLFLAHGFFKDKEAGDGIWNPRQKYTYVTQNGGYLESSSKGEIFDDTNGNGVKDSNEKWQDLGKGHEFPGYPVYTKGVDLIGTATNYNRSTRRTSIDIEGSNIKVPEGEYLISMKFDDHSLDYEYTRWAEEGLLYVTFPPSEYNCTMSVQASPLNYKETGETLEITNQEYRELMQEGNDYFTKQNFHMTPLDINPIDTLKKIGIISLISIIIIGILVSGIILITKKKKKS